jgi:hypothetical protein
LSGRGRSASLDGKLWLRYPYWVRSMRKLTRIGLHTFYRPRLGR